MTAGAQLQRVDVLMARGFALAEALQSCGLDEADYFSAKADYLGTRTDEVRRLYEAAKGADWSFVPSGYLAGVCTVCGGAGGFEDFNPDNPRESGRCVDCGSFNRQRQMARILRLSLGLRPMGPVALPQGLRAHNTESNGVLHALLSAHPGYSASEYWGPAFTPGQVVEGIRHEDLQNLSFEDESLDLLMSSDVLEHMPSPYDAHAEIFRVLKPGGRHIFTVPYHTGDTDDVRAKLEGGQVVHLAEPAYHGDPVRPEEGILVWTVFGAQMLDKLRALGFHAAMWVFCDKDSGILGPAVVFDALKAGPARYAMDDADYAAGLRPQPDTLQAELHAATARVDALTSELAQSEARAAAHAKRVAALEASTLWRLTAPMRAMAAKLKKR